MLQQLFHTLIVSVICMVWGLPVLLVSYGTIIRDNFWFRSFPALLSFLFFSGCISLGFLSSWLCLFMPLRFLYLLLLTAVLVTFLLLRYRKRIYGLFSSLSKLPTLFSITEFLYLSICVFLFIALGAMKPINFDTQIYHLQVIQWQATYGVVPGIANLFPRIGQGSNWFNLIAFFEIPLFRHENFSYVNISFVIWFFTWLFSSWKYHQTDSGGKPAGRTLSLFYFLFFIFCMYDWQLYRDAANSTNYDFQVTGFIIILVSYFIEEIVTNQPRRYFSIPIVLFALTIVSFKFSGIFILFLILYYLITNGNRQAWLKTAVLGFLIIVPVLIKNYIITGYPLFPQPLNFGKPPDWQLPRGLAEGNYWYILNYNRFFNYWFMIGKVANTPFNWLPFWLKGIQLQHKVVLVTALSSVLLFFIPVKIPINYRRLRHLLAILLLMISGWFLTAPDPGRFGYGPLLSAAFILVSLLAGRFLTIKIYRVLVIVLLVVVARYTYQKTGPLQKETRYLLYPMSTEEPSYKTFYVNGIGIHLPDIILENWDHRLYNTPLPGTGEENRYLQPRGKSIRDGFRMQPYPDSLFIKNYTY